MFAAQNRRPRRACSFFAPLAGCGPRSESRKHRRRPSSKGAPGLLPAGPAKTSPAPARPQELAALREQLAAALAAARSAHEIGSAREALLQVGAGTWEGRQPPLSSLFFFPFFCFFSLNTFPGHP